MRRLDPRSLRRAGRRQALWCGSAGHEIRLRCADGHGRPLRRRPQDLRRKIKLALVSDEEGPYGLGTNALIEDGYLSDVDFSIITEPSAGFDGKPFPDVCLGARGGYGLEIRFYGKSAHAANPEKGHSALLDAAKVAQALEQVDYVEDPHLGKGTCCVVGISADGGACSVPDFAVLRLFWHIVVGESPDTIVREIEKAVQRAGITGRYEICFPRSTVRGPRGFMPYTVPRTNP